MRFKFSLYGTPVAVSGRTFERDAAEHRVAPDVRWCDPERPLVNASVSRTNHNHARSLHEEDALAHSGVRFTGQDL
jgi:hypothetical protein